MEQIATWRNGPYGVAITKSTHTQERFPFRVTTSVFDGVKWQSNHYGKYKTLRGAENASAEYRSALSGNWTQTQGVQQ